MLQDISHIGIVVNDIEQALALWTGVLGYQEIERALVEVEGVRNAFVSAGEPRGAATCIELMQPLDPTDMSNPIARRLKDVGEGVFHVAIYADSPLAASKQLQEAGLVVIERPPVWDGEDWRAIVHPKSMNGLLLEVCARPESAPA